MYELELDSVKWGAPSFTPQSTPRKIEPRSMGTAEAVAGALKETPSCNRKYAKLEVVCYAQDKKSSDDVVADC